MRKDFHDQYIPEPMSGCWLWLGVLAENGYARCGSGQSGRYMLAHRRSWQIHKGEIPGGLCVLHKCDVRSCVNPDHLFLGSKADNSSDMVRKSRSAKGSRHGRAKLDEQKVKTIKLMNEKHKQIAKLFEVSEPTIWQIKTGRIWRHV